MYVSTRQVERINARWSVFGFDWSVELDWKAVGYVQGRDLSHPFGA